MQGRPVATLQDRGEPRRGEEERPDRSHQEESREGNIRYLLLVFYNISSISYSLYENTCPQ